MSTLASLLGGSSNANANANAVTANGIAPAVGQDMGLSSLAQLLSSATGTANSALPKPVQAIPSADSATLGLQEMQNMIQEGQAAQ